MNQEMPSALHNELALDQNFSQNMLPKHLKPQKSENVANNAQHSLPKCSDTKSLMTNESEAGDNFSPLFTFGDEIV